MFILLTLLGRKSLIAGVNRSSVIDAMVQTLGKLLTPLSNAQTSNTNHLDITLIGWVLLFLSVCLDTIAVSPPCLEGNNEKSREQGTANCYTRLKKYILNYNLTSVILLLKRSTIPLGIYSRRICNAKEIR